MNQLEIKKAFVVALILNLFLGLLSQADFFWSKILGFEGFTTGIASAGVFLIILIPLCALLSGIIVTSLSKTHKIANFFTGVSISLLLSALLVLVITNYNQSQSNEIMSEMYAEDPQLRPIGDPLRPITIVSPIGPYDTKPGEVIDVTVYAIDLPEYKSGLPIELVILGNSGTGTVLNRKVITLGKLNKSTKPLADGRSTFVGEVTIPVELVLPTSITDIFLSVGIKYNDIISLRLIDN